MVISNLHFHRCSVVTPHGLCCIQHDHFFLQIVFFIILQIAWWSSETSKQWGRGYVPSWVSLTRMSWWYVWDIMSCLSKPQLTGWSLYHLKIVHCPRCTGWYTNMDSSCTLHHLFLLNFDPQDSKPIHVAFIPYYLNAPASCTQNRKPTRKDGT